MNDSTRMKLEEEVCRGLDRLKQLNPESEEYQKASSKLVQMAELINKDDEAKNRYDIDREKLDAEASLEASRSGSESEKLRLETEKLRAQLDQRDRELELEGQKLEQEKIRAEKEAKRTVILTCVTSGVTLLSFIGTWIANAISQNRSEQFEESGHAYTSRFSRFQVKEPNHPSAGIKK